MAPFPYPTYSLQPLSLIQTLWSHQAPQSLQVQMLLRPQSSTRSQLLRSHQPRWSYQHPGSFDTQMLR